MLKADSMNEVPLGSAVAAMAICAVVEDKSFSVDFFAASGLKWVVDGCGVTANQIAQLLVRANCKTHGIKNCACARADTFLATNRAIL